eukprot:1151943-Pelagomonas_calceolata.AAC.5
MDLGNAAYIHNDKDDEGEGYVRVMQSTLTMARMTRGAGCSLPLTRTRVRAIEPTTHMDQGEGNAVYHPHNPLQPRQQQERVAGAHMEGPLAYKEALLLLHKYGQARKWIAWTMWITCTIREHLLAGKEIAPPSAQARPCIHKHTLRVGEGVQVQGVYHSSFAGKGTHANICKQSTSPPSPAKAMFAQQTLHTHIATAGHPSQNVHFAKTAQIPLPPQ